MVVISHLFSLFRVKFWRRCGSSEPHRLLVIGCLFPDSPFKNEAGSNAFTLSPQRWIEVTNAVGIISKSGRYGGTYAHSDIAFEFASWISPEFKLYIIKDYQRLKKDEAEKLALGWDSKRELSKINYRIHTDAVKEFLITPELTPQETTFKYVSEADVLNMALFGKQQNNGERKLEIPKKICVTMLR